MKRYFLENSFLKQGFAPVIGCDEVGRGSLAGPVVAAAVSLEKPKRAASWWKYVNDSKTLSPANREELALEIKNAATGWGIGTVSNKVVDRINIHQASLRAMKQAVDKVVLQLPSRNIFVMVDGKFKIPGWQGTQLAIVKGDALVHSIAAASIVAKVYRDNLMRRLHQHNPDYGLNTHKGYATLKHRLAIKQHGLSPIHRVSFCGNIV